MPTDRFSWLHLTDFHYGLDGQDCLWPTLREPFLDDLARLHDLCGPWNVVLFTGDFVQSGESAQYVKMQAEVLDRLWSKLGELGSGGAVLLGVPGNHDLYRPNPKAADFDDPAVDTLLEKKGFQRIEAKFWTQPAGSYRRAIDEVFAAYTHWWQTAPHRPDDIRAGALPGDFSATLECGGRRIGIVGLNTTFLQLAGGDYRKRLVWEAHQLHAVCEGGVDVWTKGHDVCLLLTHQGPDWLTPEAKNHGETEIAPAGRFAAHLFGHQHETDITYLHRGGGREAVRLCQGCSVFGMKKFGDPPETRRSHGYAAGRIEFGKKGAVLRIWPRLATDKPDGWRFIPDDAHAKLRDDDRGTEPESVAARSPAAGVRPGPKPTAVEESSQTTTLAPIVGRPHSTLWARRPFFGRAKELERIARWLLPHDRSWGVVVDGPGGVGKTALALEAAHRAPVEHFPIKLWITAKGRELYPEGERQRTDHRVEDYYALLGELGQALGRGDIAKAVPEDRPGLVRHALASHRALLVLDNLETFSAEERRRVFELLSSLPNPCRAIVTSRRHAASSFPANTLRLGELERAAAEELLDELGRRSPPVARLTENERRDLYDETGGNPLLLTWTVGQLGRAKGRCRTVEAAVERLQKAHMNNDPLGFVFGDLVETFTPAETAVLAALVHFTRPARIEWMAPLAELSPRAAETALDGLRDRALLVEDDQRETWLLPPLAARFLRRSCTEAVQASTERLAAQTHAIAAETRRSIAVGGDVRGSILITGDGNRVSILTGDGRQVPASEAEPELLFTAYLASLISDCGRLPLGIIDTQFVRAGAGEQRLKLPEVYVDLDVVAAPRRKEDEGDGRDWAWRLVRGEAGGRTPVIEALGGGNHHVLLGDPGSGKTTFAHYLCHALASGDDRMPAEWSGLIPVRFVLREVAAQQIPAGAGKGRAAMLWDALGANLAESLGADGGSRLLPYLRQRMLEKGALVVLDGLDEVPEARRRRQVLVEAVTDFARELETGGSRLLVTARPYAYADPRWHLKGFDIVALAPFSDRQVEGFIDRWYLTAARRVFAWSEATAEARARQLRAALDSRPYLGDLASRPLLLTLMATLHSSWGQLPEDRADLYEETVKLLLSRWQRAREVRGASGERVVEPSISQVLEVDESRLRGVLEKLAYDVHRRQGADTEEGEERGAADMPAEISRGEFLVAFEPLLSEVPAEQLLGYLEDRAGLLIHRREGVWAFPHRSFQEYLAACHLGSLPDPNEEIRRHVFDDPRWWREVALLAVNRAKRAGLGNAVSLLQALQPANPPADRQPEEGAWQAAVICGHAVLELRLAETLGERPHFAVVVERAKRWLVALVAGGRLSAKERAEAGDVLGRLGDPRPGVGVVSAGGVTLPAVEWLEVPGGRFTMGSSEDEKLAWKDERPEHQLELERFWIGRYPLTNAQLRPFVEGDGYSNHEYWTDAGWTWRQGKDEPDLSIYREEDRQKIADWLAKRPAEKRDRPFFWDDPKWGAATRPVVGVTWYEASAFCRWLAARYRAASAVPGLAFEPKTVSVQLPTEAQWENAARGADGRRWPWEGDFDAGRCNASEGELGETSPVGMYPAGRSPCGADEMAGSVWEWCSTIWDEKKFKYPYGAEDGREQADGQHLRVVRGGSWYSEKKFARCAARSWVGPDDFDDDVGFRVVLSLANSEY